MPNELVINGNHIQSLSKLLGSSEHSLDLVPQLIVKIVDNNMWQEYIVPRTGEIVTFDDFAEFVKTPPLEGLGVTMEVLKRLCRDNPAAMDAIDRATARANGGDRRSEGFSHNNVMTENATQGNSPEYALRKLRKDAPELHQDVIEGKISPHAAMVEAGFRDYKLQYYPGDAERTANLLLKNMTADDIEILVTLLLQGLKEDDPT